MKKFLLTAIFLLLGSTLVFSQSYFHENSGIQFRLGAYGGYNFSGKTVHGGGFARVSGLSMMAEIDVGWTDIDFENKSMIYLNPSVGLYYGDKVRIWGLIGITNWPEYRPKEDRFITDKIYGKLKLGVDVMLGSKMFLTVNWNYVFGDDRPPRHHYDYNYDPYDDHMYFKCSALDVGFGVKF